MKSAATLSAALALLSGTTEAFWRMGCHSRTAFLRLDPIVEPGTVSNHGHVIHGGSNFKETTTYEDLRDSECTSCRFKDDKSAYWTPSLHFIHENGTTEAVPQVGGMLAYYLLFGKDLKAFPPGFQMLAGDTRLRNFSGPVPDPEKSLWGPEDKTQHALAQKSLGFNCLDYAKAPEGSMYRHFLPDKEFLDGNCKNGIRAEIFFPSCWNGKDLKSDNNKDHVAYPDLINSGECPEGYDVRLPSLFYETIWDTFVFAGVPGTFTWANGDPTGYGYHGDFMMGWDKDVLQRAVDTCTNESGVLEDCPVFAENNGLQTEEDGRQCKIQAIPDILKDDNCDGPADGLCGNVPVQNGPNYASLLQPGGTDAPTGAPVPTDVAPVPTLSYQSARSMITDEYGGGISVYNNKPTKAADAEQPAPTEDAPPADAPPAQEGAPPAEAPPAPEVTPAPEAPPANASPAKGKIIGTSTYTSAGQVFEVAIEEVIVYVTVEAPGAAAPPARRHRRHVHHPHHRMGFRHTF